ncbi:MAG: hypothetical protein OEU36_19175, partial [Gammaproteobacteria bacterium]|nr:hypothetical protein [Gammaproteobacteria bacterium]
PHGFGEAHSGLMVRRFNHYHFGIGGCLSTLLGCTYTSRFANLLSSSTTPRRHSPRSRIGFGRIESGCWLLGSKKGALIVGGSNYLLGERLASFLESRVELIGWAVVAPAVVAYFALGLNH